MRIILLRGVSSCERKQEIGSVLAFVSAVISIYRNRDFNAVTISRFLEQPLQEISSKSNPAHPHCWRCDSWGSGAGCPPVPPKGLGGSLQSSRLSVHQGLTPMVSKVQAELTAEKKKKVFSDSKDSVHLPLPSFVQNNFPILIASEVATDSLYN